MLSLILELVCLVACVAAFVFQRRASKIYRETLEAYREANNDLGEALKEVHDSAVELAKSFEQMAQK